MPRLIVPLSLATLCLFSSCVDIKKPARVSRCEQDNTCTDGTGGATGGKDGAAAGAAGSTSRSADAGVGDAPVAGGGGGGTGGLGGMGGDAGGSAGGGSVGGSTTGQGGTVVSTGGSGGGTSGGRSDAVDAGTKPHDAQVDTPLGDFDVPFDTSANPDSPPDNRPALEVARPETAPEPGRDAPRDTSLDSLPDRPDTAFDASTCIQTFKSSGYSLSSSSDAGVNACSECKDNNGNPLESQCRRMIDCLVPLWVCRPGNTECWIGCRNGVAGDMVLNDCVSALVNKACP